MSDIPPSTDPFFSKNVFKEENYFVRYQRVTEVMQTKLIVSLVEGIKVVDLGCGMGGFGRHFLSLGADVTFLDGRQSNLDDLQKELPSAKTILFNVETDKMPQVLFDADLILCMGLIYHLTDPKLFLQKLASVSCPIFLETNCLDHDGEALIYFEESTEPRQFSVMGGACRPSPGWVTKNLKEVGYNTVEDISHKNANKPAAPGHPGEIYDWEFQRTCGWRRDECSLRKLYLAYKGSKPAFFK